MKRLFCVYNSAWRLKELFSVLHCVTYTLCTTVIMMSSIPFCLLSAKVFRYLGLFKLDESMSHVIWEVLGRVPFKWFLFKIH